MKPPIPPGLFVFLLAFGMLILMELGRQAGIRRRSKEKEGDRGSLGPIEGAVFALFGLLMAFTAKVNWNTALGPQGRPSVPPPVPVA